jgi:hypothetical protein
MRNLGTNYCDWCNDIYSLILIFLFTGDAAGLYLSGNNLNGTIPTEIGLMTSLKWLELGGNEFTGTVPTSLASLPLGQSSRSLLFLCSFATFLTCAHPLHYYRGSVARR